MSGNRPTLPGLAMTPPVLAGDAQGDVARLPAQSPNAQPDARQARRERIIQAVADYAARQRKGRR